jgi:NAD-dependent dihydropyrimidine dehydrogenase PreA subunit
MLTRGGSRPIPPTALKKIKFEKENLMAKDLSQQTWHGVPRKGIPWFPTVDYDACIGCDLCYLTCGRDVFERDDVNRVQKVERPYNCMVGCSTCQTVCPVEAISFPDREIVWKVEKEHRIFGVVKKEVLEKKKRIEMQQSQAATEAEALKSKAA